MKKKGLRSDGKRSDAGLHRTSMIWLDPDDITIVGLDTKDGPGHHLYDKRILLPLNDDDIANVRVYGVLKPVLVQRDGNRWLLVDGRGRVRRAREAKKLQAQAGEVTLKVKCVPTTGKEPMIFGISRAANTGHTKDGPLQMAEHAARLTGQYGMSQQQAAVTLGASQSTVSQWLALLDLSPKCQAAVERGQVTASAVSKFAKLDRKEQDASLAKLLESGAKPTAAAARNVVRAKNGEAPVVTARGRIVQALGVLNGLSSESSREALAEAIAKLREILA